MEKDMIVGERVRKLRRCNGYSQEEFSELLGISRMALSRLENGVTSLDMQLLGRIVEVVEGAECEILPDVFPKRKCCMRMKNSQDKQ